MRVNVCLRVFQSFFVCFVACITKGAFDDVFGDFSPSEVIISQLKNWSEEVVRSGGFNKTKKGEEIGWNSTN